jgi:hypothetical protein
MEGSQVPAFPSAELRRFTLNNIQERNIGILCEVARQNGATLNLKEIIDLTSLDIGEEELENAWNRSEYLSARYKIVCGQISQKNRPSLRQTEDVERYTRAKSNLDYARKFALLFQAEENLELLSVSGSTSYGSVSDRDDLDFFCIAKDDSLWLFLSKALIRGRLFRARERESPDLCFSYVIEESNARKLFSRAGDGLFARDAINAIVLKGEAFYGGLLRQNKAIASYFPKMYDTRVSELSKRQNCRQPSASSVKFSIIHKIANRVLQYTLGNYIRFKSQLLNRKFANAGDDSRIFKIKIDKGSCLFESNDYLELRRKYADFESVS